MDRRSFLKGLAGIFAAGVAPAVLPSGVIMPVRKLWTPQLDYDVEVLPLRVRDYRALAMAELVEWYQNEIQRFCGLQPYLLEPNRRALADLIRHYGRADG